MSEANDSTGARLSLALGAFLGEHRHCWRLHGDGLELDGAWLLCGCGATLFVRELLEHLQPE